MRVIAGERKGTRLKAVPGVATRPTSDKVKEALFQRIGPYFSEGTGLDLYGGSGALGLEALSRGLEKMIIVDRALPAVKVIRENVKRCHYSDRTDIYHLDAMQALKKFAKIEEAFSYIFLDPPYAAQQLIRDLTFIQEANLHTTDGLIIAEHDREVELPASIGRLYRAHTKNYRETAVTIFGL